MDLLRVEAFGQAPAGRRSELGQYPTPASVAVFMASLFGPCPSAVRLLDAGAGVGSLSAAFVAGACGRAQKPPSLAVTAFEIDEALADALSATLGLCGESARAAGVDFSGEVRREDFICAAAGMLGGGLFGGTRESFTHAILNPPYKKISSDGDHRRLLRTVGIETSNLYTAFLALAVMLLEPGGELVAITPRSFCNGPYFKPFRQFFLREMSLRRIHVFESRTRAFADDDVLQENVIFHAVRHGGRPEFVVISSSEGPGEPVSAREVSPDELVKPGDLEQFIHIVPDEDGGRVAELMAGFTTPLGELGLSVSTGRVVDFRARRFLRADPDKQTAPLIHPCHLSDGWVAWPKAGAKKPGAIVSCRETADLLLPGAVYVLVKRFSAKEEKRRIVAGVYDDARIPAPLVGFENHLNYFHENGAGLPMNLAKGLAGFLNSTPVDDYFRQFNGHTQVNASDLRNLPYPTRRQLEALGTRIGETFPTQAELDRMIEGLARHGKTIESGKGAGRQAEDAGSDRSAESDGLAS